MPGFNVIPMSNFVNTQRHHYFTQFIIYAIRNCKQAHDHLLNEEVPLKLEREKQIVKLRHSSKCLEFHNA